MSLKFLAFIPARVRAALAFLLFLVGWAALDAAFNIRYPSLLEEPKHWYLLPSLDVCVLLGVLALVGWRRWRMPIWGTLAIALGVTLARLLRVADGLVQLNYYRPVNLFIDLPLLPDFVHFTRRTVPYSRVLLWGLMIAGAIVLTLVLAFAAVLYVQRYLAAGRWQRVAFGGVLVVMVGLSWLWPTAHLEELHRGLFGRSVVPLALSQVRSAVAAARIKRTKTAEIRAVQERLQKAPSDLRGLHGADLLFFLVESYGSGIFTNHYLRSMRCPALDVFDTELSKHGYFAASSFLNSTTYGGGSWWAQATMTTGVVVRNEVEYAVTEQADPFPRTMVQAFKEAGYRTVMVAPGAIRNWPEGFAREYDRKYYNKDLGYEGPSFGWFTMTDEYMLDFVHRREIDPARSPLFIEFSLVSSHAPWTMQPLPVHDWSKLDKGWIYFRSHVVRFPARRDNVEERAAAYAYSICYDFDVLRHYITERLTHDSFVVILGDHQPAGDIIYEDPSWAVPIHLVSRNRTLIDRFRAAGYSAGMTPIATGNVPGLETFLPLFLELLSGAPPALPQQNIDP